MAERRWTRDEVCELARGRMVGGRDLHAGVVEPPAWLIEASDGLWPQDSAGSLEHLHPDDREGLIGAFLTSASSPGEPVRVVSRGRGRGYWNHSESTWLNLVDHEDVGMIVLLVREVDGPPIVPPAQEQIGEHTPTHWMMWTLSESGVLLSVEGACRELLGYEPDELVGRHPSEFWPADTVSDGVAMWVKLHEQGGGTATSRRHWVRRDGSRIWLEDSVLRRVDHHDGSFALSVLWDATAKMAQEEELRRRQAELVAREAEKSSLAAQMEALAADFKILADEVPAAVFRCDETGRVLFHNARWTELVGEQDGVGRLHDLVAPAERAVLDRLIGELVQSDTSQRRSVEVAGHGDTDHRVWRVSLRGTGDGAQGRSLVGSIEDVSTAVRHRREARQDSLTSLLNRTALDERLAEVLCGDASDVLVFFIDLDGFKAVNDTWGHEAGDVVLSEIARRLRASVRPEDTVGRYGGDEFVVVCTDVGLAPPSDIVDRITDDLRGEIAFRGGTWTPSASIGWAFGRAGDDPASVVRRADVGMYEQKRERHRPV